MLNKPTTPRSSWLKVIVALIILFIVIRWLNRPETTEEARITREKAILDSLDAIASNPVKPICVVDVLNQDDNSYHIVVKLTATDTNSVFKAAKECEAYYCPDGHCSMVFYDDKRAYALYQEKMKVGVQGIKSWERKHRNFMSDHTLAYIWPNEDFVTYYPLVDLTYKELGGKNLRGKDL